MFAWFGRLWNRRRGYVIAGTLVVLAVLSFGATRIVRSAPAVPTAEVKLGEFVDYVQIRGEVKALRSIVLTAPSRAGDIQILQIARTGTIVKKGDPVVQFDSTNLQRQLDERRSALRQSEAEIERGRAQARITEEQNQTELTKARYDVQRARLEASKQEILSAIEGEKNKLALANAEQKLREIEQKLKSDRAAAAADIESLRQKRAKALADVRQYETNIVQMTLRAPADGMVTLLQNWRARGFFGGGSAPEFKQGDRAWSGAAIAELPDLSTIRVNARIEESDRGRVRTSQTVSVRVDAVPDKQFAGTVAAVSPMAKVDFSGWPPVKNFDLSVALQEVDPRLRPGMSATGRIAVERVPDSLLVPAEAVFAKGGRSVVYVLNGSRFEERPVITARRGSGQVVVARGVRAGERVALKDPTIEEAAEEKK